MTPADVTDDLAAAQAELTRLLVVNTELRSRVERLETGTLAADLEALRAKARALFPVDNGITIPSFAALYALRAELDKPSGASRLAEIAKAHKAIAHVPAEQDGKPLPLWVRVGRLSAIADAWKALAKARAEILGRPDAWADEEIRGRLLAAKAALRALGIDPEAK